MPSRQRPPRFPSRTVLLRFLAARQPVSVRRAARLLGWTMAQVRREALTDSVLLLGDRVPWEDVAYHLFFAWPRALVLDTLREDTHLLPHELQLTRPAWDIPTYLVRAMEEQARVLACPRRPQAGATVRGVADLVADVLHSSIDNDAIVALRRDPSFAAAFEFPFWEQQS